MMIVFIKSVLITSICLVIVCAQAHSNDSQAAASQKIKDWQYQYNRYVFDTLKHRESGCTFEKLQYRREW